MEIIYFLDTYAIFEIIKGNRNYLKFIDKKCHTSLLNLYELYFHLLRDFGETVAEYYFKKYLVMKCEIKEEYIAKAATFRLKYLKQNLSYVDALGYTIAVENNFSFLTGDKEFKNLEHVTFVK